LCFLIYIFNIKISKDSSNLCGGGTGIHEPIEYGAEFYFSPQLKIKTYKYLIPEPLMFKDEENKNSFYPFLFFEEVKLVHSN
jgi:hypothetical protein